MTQHAVPDEVTACLAKWPNLIKVGDDNDWKVWVDSGYLDSSDFGAVVRGEFRSSIKARALLTLLAPRREWNPLYWPYLETGGSNYMPTFALQVDAIPADLMPFCVSLVTTFCDLLPY